MKHIRAAIVGAAGYSGEELLRLLLRHPSVKVTCVTSRQYAGCSVGEVFPRFMEEELSFSLPEVSQIAEQAEIAFLALPHGLAAEFAIPLLDLGLTVIDISADFRLRDPKTYERYYGKPHPAPDLLAQAVYGLPERYGNDLKQANLIACPGCYPTSIILPVAPLLENDLVKTVGITAVSQSGVSGAGRKVDLPFIFPECNESVRPYNVTCHRHSPEIEQELASVSASRGLTICFIPHLVPINRGIHSTIILLPNKGITGADVEKVLKATYDDKPFVRVLPSGALADTKHVTMTNMCEIGFAFDTRSERVILSSAIDNLTKGASGQAVQCLNIRFGLSEDAGLR